MQIHNAITRLNPTSLFGPVGGSGLEVLELRNACTSAWGPALNPSYWSDNSAIASIVATGDVSLVGVGSTSLRGNTRYFRDALWECRFVFESDNTPTTVKPVVTQVQGPDRVPLRAAGSSGPNSIQLAASGLPPGGSFHWETTSNKVSLSNEDSATVTVTSVAASNSRNDVPITVTFTVDNVPSDPLTVQITVVRPASLQLVSDTTNPTGHICDPDAPSNECNKSSFEGGGVYSSYRRDRTYHVMDHLNPAQWIAGFPLVLEESFSAPSGQCAGDAVATGGGIGDTVIDCFYFCSEACRTGGSCSPSATQTIKANGFVVATKNVNWTCSGVAVQ